MLAQIPTSNVPNFSIQPFQPYLAPKQIILLATPIIKINASQKKQERNLVITNQNFLNLQKTKLKRTIKIGLIKAITVSRVGSEFVVHVPEQYDYRFSCKNRQLINLIISKILEASGSSLLVFNREQMNLGFCTITKEVKKKQGHKLPQSICSVFDRGSFQNYLSHQKLQLENKPRQIHTIYSRNNPQQSVCFEDFTINQYIRPLCSCMQGSATFVIHKTTKQSFARRQIKKDLTQSTQFPHLESIKIILEHINHPFLVKLAFIFEAEDRFYYLMQYMKRKNLYTLMRKLKKLQENNAKFFVMQIALGLSHYHEKGYIYRHLSIWDIFLDDKGYVCLDEIGSKNHLKHSQLVEYLAHQILLNLELDQNIDWWALGIITYAMIIGVPPFYNKSQEKTLQLIHKQKVKFPADVEITDQGRDFILKMLKKNPKERLGSHGGCEEILSHPWFKSLDRNKIMKKQIPSPFQSENIDADQNINYEKILKEIEEKVQNSSET